MHDPILPSDAAYPTGATVRLAKRRESGLTLIELLVTIAVLAITLTWAVPGYQQFTARNEVAAEVMRLKTALSLARNTAITRRSTISVCSSPAPAHTECTFDDWSHPWVIVEGEAAGGSLSGDTILRVMKGPDGVNVSFNRDDRPVRFSIMGWSQGYNGTFDVCGRESIGAAIVLSNTGRSREKASSPSC